MSRITGTDAANLIEAYASVYTSEEEIELTEEQIQEDFENWVNSLVEEGYDLSEYTWEDMYEEYLNEMGQRMTTGQATAPKPTPVQTSPKPTPSVYRPGGGRQEYNQRRSGTGQMPSPTTPRPSAAPYQSRFSGARDAAFARARQIQGSPVVGPRPVAPVQARPAQTTATRPAPSAAPKSTPTPTATQTSSQSPVLGYQLAQKGTNIGSNILKPRTSALDDIRAMRKASQQRIMGQGGTPATPLVQSFDPFDIVMGYLIDEGYADNEEAAAVIMANMSEEWREEILEAYGPAMAGAVLQKRLEQKVRADERKKIEQEKKGASGASSQVRGA